VWQIALGVTIFAVVVAITIPLFRRRRPWQAEPPTELDRLFAEKAQVLRTIKDLDHEHEAGILSDADWKEARAAQLAEAVRLNREIQALTGVAPGGDA
jgi:hypothetical protein